MNLVHVFSLSSSHQNVQKLSFRYLSSCLNLFRPNQWYLHVRNITVSSLRGLRLLNWNRSLKPERFSSEYLPSVIQNQERRNQHPWFVRRETESKQVHTSSLLFFLSGQPAQIGKVELQFRNSVPTTSGLTSPKLTWLRLIGTCHSPPPPPPPPPPLQQSVDDMFAGS